ncbi:serpin family protein [Zavarzinella formosa]|uniref:serpin family protein n=1 Tax=Zavarzinella formosa TaxID=360055 RepID=UPI0012F9608C
MERGTRHDECSTKKSEPSRAHMIRFNHPFLSLITDSKTKTVLFLGRVTDQRAE